MTTRMQWLAIAALVALAGPGPAQMPPDMLRMIPLVSALDADADGSLSADEIERAPAVLTTLDADGNGVLTSDELAQPAGEFGRGRGGGMLQRLPVMTALDRDGNGEISAEEIRSATAALLALDADGTGTLATSELTPGQGGRGRGGTGRGQGPPLAALPIMAALDRDGTGEISADELSEASRALRTLDADGDGTLRQGELAPRGGRGEEPPGRPARGPGGGPGGTRGPGGGPGGMLAMLPLVTSLDADRSGEIEANEIDSASDSLATLDTDGSGNLTENELMPASVDSAGPDRAGRRDRRGVRGGGGFGGKPLRN